MDEEYDSNKFYTGPGKYTVYAYSDTNKASYAHDKSKGWNVPNPWAVDTSEADEKWISEVDPNDPVGYIGTVIWKLKAAASRALKLPRVNENYSAVRPANVVAPTRVVGDDETDGSQIYGMPRSRYSGRRRRFSGRKRSTFSRIPRKVFRRSNKRRFTGRKRFRGGKRGGRFGRALRRVMKKVQNLQPIAPNASEVSMHAVSTGALNQWKYRVVDNMFSYKVDTADAYQARGWNMLLPLTVATTNNLGVATASQLVGENYRFTYRQMTTLFQSPTNTPTFVEVYLLKPLHSDRFDTERGNVLKQFDALSTAGTAGNPGENLAYLYTGGNAAIINHPAYQADGVSELSYNPLTDRTYMNNYMKITKKWKFTLGPYSTKSITLRSKKPFRFNPGQFALSTASVPTTPVAVTMNQYAPCSRIMVVRWHGFQSVSSETATFGVAKAGLTADPLMVRRYFRFKCVPMTQNFERVATNTNFHYAETDRSKLLTFGASNNAGVVAFQP